MRREISRTSVIPSGIAGKTIDSFPSAAESIIGFRFRMVSQKGTTETHFAGTGTALPQGYNLSGRGSTVPPKSRPRRPSKKAFGAEDFSNQTCFAAPSVLAKTQRAAPWGKCTLSHTVTMREEAYPDFKYFQLCRHKVGRKITRPEKWQRN